jgi:hypothetical protein
VISLLSPISRRFLFSSLSFSPSLFSPCPSVLFPLSR